MANLAARRAEIGDVDQLVELHMSNVARDELSMLLGRSFLHDFYLLCVRHEKSRTIVLCEGTKVIGMSVTWSDHYGIATEYRRRVFPKLLGHLILQAMAFRIGTVSKILAYGIARETYKLPDNIAPYCVEMTILDRSVRADPAKAVAFFKMYGENVEQLKRECSGGIWASAQSENRSSIRMIANVIKPTEQHILRRRPKEVTCFVYRRGAG